MKNQPDRHHQQQHINNHQVIRHLIWMRQYQHENEAVDI